ncbi:MAG: glycosyltransferase family 4 protein [Lachnospiraceae bacterium]|nr:glycosyltransferase family 4 protein [Lachnospiraceae bacterium]
MKILHLLSGGGIGGIEVLCRDIAKLSQEQNEFCFLYDGGAIADEMKEKNIPVYLYYTEKLPGRMHKLIQLVKREKYDVVIVHHEGIGIYAFYLTLLYRFRKIKFIKYLHCSFEEKYFYEGNRVKDWLNYHILKKTLNKSDCMIAVSEFVKKSYCNEFRCNEDKVKVIYNGIELIQEREEKRQEDFGQDPVTLLYIGRLIEGKGVDLLLRAMQKLIEAGENLELIILGDGPERFKCEKLARKLKIESKVHFEGYQTEKQRYYDRADIFVCPSRWEAFGISIVEALAQEMICVASNVGGIPEIVEDGKDGFLFESGNVDDLTEALKKATNCFISSRYFDVAAAARQKSRKFDINNMIYDLQGVCRELIEG